MNQVDSNTFNHKFSVTPLPAEMLFGIKTINCNVKCNDDVYRPVTGVEIGFIFFKVSYAHMRWEN